MDFERKGSPPSRRTEGLRALVAASCLAGFAACVQDSGPEPVDREAALVAYREGLQHFHDEELDAAVAACRRAIELDPGLAEAHWVLGKVLYFRSDVVIGTPTRDDALLAEAARELVRAAELEPKNVDYRYWAGRALALLGDTEAAAASFRRVLELDAEHGHAYKALALVERDAGDEGAARENFEQAVRYLPEDADLWFHYGMQLEMEEDVDGARTAYERSRALDWTVPRTYTRLAVLLRQLGDPEGAEEATREFEKWSDFGAQLNDLLTRAHADRKDVESHMALGELYMSARRHKAAAVWFRRACLTDPGNRAAELALRKAQAEVRRDDEEES